jgi:tetratricopeptide (TPR) repeat protein
MAWTEAKETKKEDIEAKLKSIGGDMLKIEYLENCLKKQSTFNIRKFVYLKLAELYQTRLMWNEAAKNVDGAAEISITFRDKMELYMKATFLLIKHGSYYDADKQFEKALACASSREKEQLKKTYKEYYLERGKEFESLKKLNNAIKVYEKLIMQGFINESEKKEINAKLVILYGKVGKVRDAMRLEGK